MDKNNGSLGVRACHCAIASPCSPKGQGLVAVVVLSQDCSIFLINRETCH